MREPLAVLFVLALAGCAEVPLDGNVGTPTEDWSLQGAWSVGSRQADMDAVCRIAREYDNECYWDLDEPPNFALRFKSEQDCQDARARLADVPNVNVADCRETDLPSQVFLGGTFTNTRTQETLDAWCAVARKYGNECALMESYPEQYRLGFPDFRTCEEARAKLAAIEHVRPGRCSAVSVPGDPDEPVTNEPDVPESWSLRGSFLSGYTQADIDRWCEIAGEFRQTCALMKSEPPQFAWALGSYEECNDARFRLQVVETITTRHCVEATPTDATYDVGTFALTWRGEDDRTHSMSWDVVRVWRSGDLITFNITTHGIEGGDFRFRMWLTPRADGGGVFFHAPGGKEPGTFDFLYNESPFWRDTIDRVESVDRVSYVRIDARDDATGELRGTFLLDFTGSCEGRTDCAEPGVAHRRVLEGRFGP